MEESYENYTQEENRKRPLEEQGDGRDSKRSNIVTNMPLLKILVPNYAAGALIGKGGSIFTELQAKYGASIRISPNREFYPGTDERIVVLTGEMNQINDLNNYIMEKVYVDQSERPDRRPRDEGRGQQVKIVLTNAAAGLLIGKGGGTIKAIQEGTKAKITIANREEAAVPGERVLTMSGAIEQRMEACWQVIEKISSDASNMANHSLKYMNTGMNLNQVNSFGFGSGQQITNGNVFGGMPKNPMPAFNSSGVGSFGGASNQNVKSKLKTSVQIQMEVPGPMVGALMGKQGQIVHELIQISGAKIQFSAKNEFAPGTNNRILTVTGDMNQAQTAYFLINQKVEVAENELNHKMSRF